MDIYIDLAKFNQYEELEIHIKEHPQLAKQSVDNLGRTLLMLASGYGSYKCVELLIDQGASVDKLDGYDNNALSYAVFNNRINVAGILLEQNPNLLHKTISENNFEECSIIELMLRKQHKNQFD